MIFLRHPKTAAPAGLCYGRFEPPDGAEAHAAVAAALAATPPVAAVIASPARRCRALAEALSARDGAPLRLDARLLELDFGAWEGRLWAEIDRAESDAWCADPIRRAPPGGETFAALRARVGAALSDAPAEAALVCHAGPIRAARMLLTGASFETAFAEPVPYAAPVRFATARTQAAGGAP